MFVLCLISNGAVKVGGGDGFDWGFSRYFREHGVPVFALNQVRKGLSQDVARSVFSLHHPIGSVHFFASSLVRCSSTLQSMAAHFGQIGSWGSSTTVRHSPLFLRVFSVSFS